MKSTVKSVVPLLVLVVVGIATPTHVRAQSKRYPPTPIDRDQEQADRSVLWENASNPNNVPYRALIAEARAAIADRTDAQYQVAADKLGRAIALLPGEAEAYALRGDVHMLLRAWAKCGDDLEAAVSRARPGAIVDPKVELELHRNLGLCLARAGKLADAERVLAEATAAGDGTGEMLMRLGEVRITMGKLDEAIAALSAAIEAPGMLSHALTRWLLAAAYDRARRPSESIDEARRAAAIDRGFTSIRGQAVPLLGTGEPEYLLGLAWASIEHPKAELATAYFRRFLKIAPDSPWRRRAEDHLKELATATLPEAIDRKGGGAAIDLDAMRAVVRRAMPAMRACLARTPSAVLDVTITRSGPRPKPTVARPRPPYRGRYPRRPPTPPPDGVAVVASSEISLDTTRAEIDGAARCVEPLVSRLALPPIKEPGAWYKLGFLVVGP